MATAPPQETIERRETAPASTSPLDGHAPPTTSAGRRPGKAMAAMILGIISIVGALIPIAGLILGILAVVFGASARSQILRERLRGRTQAMAGIVCGAVGIVLSLANWIASAIMMS